MRYLERVTHPAKELGINKSERLLNLTIALMSFRSGLSKSDIFLQIPGYPQNPESADRMFERDKEDLRNIGIEIQVLDLKNENRYRIENESLQEMDITLAQQERLLVNLAVNSYSSTLFDQFSKLKMYGFGVPLTTSNSSRVRSFQLDTDNITTILKAISNRKIVQFEYRNRDGNQSLKEIIPLKLIIRSSLWYLVGKYENTDEIRTFSLKRVLGKIAESAKTYSLPEGFLVSKELLSINEVVEVSLLISPGAMHEWERFATKTLRTDEGLRLTLEVEDLQYFIFQLFQLGSAVKVLSPDFLITEIKNICLDIVNG